MKSHDSRDGRHDQIRPMKDVQKNDGHRNRDPLNGIDPVEGTTHARFEFRIRVSPWSS